eukprot:TRINITY_DN10655_c0_g1_i2.p1 TRINITY_DN10655_c0_g1~~TRINITY_DN10655_c0_g1_i2.p1  ORF type:complete len:229 (-),score=22.78 TRINITY_DN10655_c0_g1_i2:187-873(-)
MRSAHHPPQDTAATAMTKAETGAAAAAAPLVGCSVALGCAVGAAAGAALGDALGAMLLAGTGRGVGTGVGAGVGGAGVGCGVGGTGVGGAGVDGGGRGGGCEYNPQRLNAVYPSYALQLPRPSLRTASVEHLNCTSLGRLGGVPRLVRRRGGRSWVVLAPLPPSGAGVGGATQCATPPASLQTEQLPTQSPKWVHCSPHVGRGGSVGAGVCAGGGGVSGGGWHTDWQI